MKPLTTNHLNKEETDIQIKLWYDIILEALKHHIPMKNYKTILNPMTNPTMKHIQWVIKQYLQTASIIGWDYERYTTYSTLKTNLMLECKTQHNKNWEDTTKGLIHVYKHQQKFLQQN